MYKDVKKKLLAVALCICIVIGAIEIVPRVQAAASSGTKVTVSKDGKEVQVTVFAEETSFKYTGKKQIPIVEKVTDLEGKDISNQFKSEFTVPSSNSNDNVNKGTFYACLQSNGGDYITSDNEKNRVQFTIEAAEINRIWTKPGSDEAQVLKFSGTPVKPTLEQVNIELKKGGTITYTGAQIDENCSIAELTQVGKGQMSKVTLKASENFTNVGAVDASVRCDVAYDLGSGNVTVLKAMKFPYTGSDISADVQVTINGETYSKKSSDLSFSFEKETATDSGEYLSVSKVTDAGKYRVTVKPADSEVAELGTQLYTGSFVGTFQVTPKDSGDYYVTADMDDKTVVLNETNSNGYRVHTAKGGVPENLQVFLDGKELSTKDYTLSYSLTDGTEVKPAPTQAGRYQMTITPNASTNYGKTYTVLYDVYSELTLKTLFFTGVAKEKPDELEYSEKGYQVDMSRIVVTNEAGVDLTKNSQYEVKYEYQRSGTWTEAAYNSADMLSVGNKRIAVYGLKEYKGETDYWYYKIVGVELNDTDFELVLGGTEFDYAGKDIKPEWSVRPKNGKTPIDASYFSTPVFKNNRNAGTATITVNAKTSQTNPYTGSLTKTFKINQLSLNDAVAEGDNGSDYYYTGEMIVPTLKINEYVLKSGDYVFDRYEDANGDTLKSAPTEPGNYTVVVSQRDGQENIVGTGKISFSISPRDISDDADGSFFLEHSSIEWNGGETKPEVSCSGTLKFEEGVDYAVVYENNTVPTASASAIITGKGPHLTGTKKISFEITKRSIGNANVKADYTVTGSVGNYRAELRVTDEGSAVKKPNLNSKDYMVSQIVYRTEKGYDLVDLTQLERAGEYVVTLTGQGNYDGTQEVIVKCGIDISDAKIETGLDLQLTFNGLEQYPDIYITVGDKTTKLESGKATADSAFTLKFTRNSAQMVESGCEGIYAGTVTVQAVGNTEKGYFGTTQVGTTYEIYPAKINDICYVDFSGDKKANIRDGKAYYEFTNEPITPNIQVKLITGSGITLKDNTLRGNVDYVVSYPNDDTRIDKGSHSLTIKGTGNFTGTVGGTTFWIEALTIHSDRIEITVNDSGFDYAEGMADGAPKLTLKLDGATVLKDQADCEIGEKADYSCDWKRVIGSDGWLDTYEYTITGKNNFYDKTSRTYIYNPVSKTTLIETNKESPAARGTYVSEWNENELIVATTDQKDSFATKRPSKFTLKYRATSGKDYVLTKDDFEVSNFEPSMFPDNNSTITIQGKGGFNHQISFKVPLFADLTKATINKSSVIQEGGTITTEKLKEAMEKSDGLSELLTFDGVWPGEDGTVATDCYTVSLPNGYTPEIGPLELTVTGKQGSKYNYTGTIKINVKVTGSLGSATIEIGDNNTIPWQGETIMPGTVNSKNTAKVLVWDGKTQLKGGYLENINNIPSDWDYYVTFTNNKGVGLATATFTGVNKYSGTISQDFKITCDLNDLTIMLPPPADAENSDWITYDGGRPEYDYQIDTAKNKLSIRLYYQRKDGGTATSSAVELDKSYYNLAYSGCESAGDATITIGESTEEKYKGILLGSNRVVKYKLREITGVAVTVTNENPIFTGKEMTKADIGLAVKYNGTELEEGADYTLSFENAVNVGTATWRVYLKGNYSGKQSGTFTIKPMSLDSTSDIKATVGTMIYTGAELLPKLTVTQLTGKTRILEEGTDYKISYYLDSTKNGIQTNPFAPVGDYYVQIAGNGNYTGTLDVPYKIEQRQLTDGVSIYFVATDECPVVNEIPACIYTGGEHCPAVQVVYNQTALNSREYSVSYTNNTNAGTATVTVTGEGSFAGTRTIEFTIQPKDITGEDISYLNNKGTAFEDEQEFEWTKSPVQPQVDVRDTTRNETLSSSADYTLKYIDYNEDNDTQTNAGKVTISIKGQGNYTGEKKFAYYIGEDISKSYTLLDGKSSVTTTYNGLQQAPNENDISVVWGASTDLTDENGNKRYRISYFKDGFEEENKVERSQIIDAGKYYISVTGVPTLGTYAKSSESNSCVYVINPRSISPSYVSVSGYDATYYYTGKAIEPKGIIVEDTDLPVTNTATDPQRRSVKLVNGTDYAVTYANNVSAGKASIIVEGKGNYTGQRIAYFNILSSSVDGNNTWDGTSEGTGSITNGSTTISAADINLGFDNSSYNCMMYNGYERIPTVSINGVSLNEFTITASNNIHPGVATLMITGRGGNFTGTILKNYTIKADLSVYGSISAIPDQTYTGYQLTPPVTVNCGGNLLNQGSDYTVTYSNNTNMGTASVIVSAASDSYYVGTKTATFNISNTATGMEITGYASSYTYTGNAITPDVVVMMNGRVLNRGTDYTVTYSNNTNVGTATMTVTGLGSFSGTKTIKFAIEAKNIENCLTTAVDNYRYTGDTYTPSVTLTDSTTGKTLVAGTDYIITYSNNTNPGTAQITVTALSKNYTGSKVISFKISSAAVSGLRATNIKKNSMKLSWTKQSYADGYQICNSNNRVIATTSKTSYTVKNLTAFKTYKYKVRSYVENADGSTSYGEFSSPVSAKTLLNTPTLKASSQSKGKVTLTWTKVSKATGYEIYYSTKKDGVYTKLKTVSKSAARKYVDSGLASGEKYYYTIRAYRKANGVKTYSNYNTIKTVKVK